MTRFDRVTDLTLVGAVLLAAVGALLVPGVPWPIEWAVAIPLVLFVPGYTVVVALFPASPAAADRSPGWAARVAIALVTSVLVVAVIGTVLSLAGVLRLAPVVLAIVGTTAIGAVLAHRRRQAVAVADRSDIYATVTLDSVPARAGLSGLQTGALVVGVVVLVGTVAVTAAAPAQGASFSEASLLADGTDDQLLGADDNVTLEANQPTTVQLRIQNHEGATTTYYIVGRLQRLGPNGSVRAAQTVTEGQGTVDAGKTEIFDQDVEPSMTGDRLRLQFLVYTESVPTTPSTQTADLTLHHWVTVEETT